jgi:glycosyltransferase involved in cell wall biosynthesis
MGVCAIAAATKRREPMNHMQSTTDTQSDNRAKDPLVASSPASMYSEKSSKPVLTQSLSVVLPAHNEEAVIAQTVTNTVSVLAQWVKDFEVIVVNDGSVDNTAAVLSLLTDTEPHLKVVTHTINQGYGAALTSGFQAASKALTFFMDADGQFDIQDIRPFFDAIKHYDAVLGYRMDRQDTWVRKLNAWGWHLLVSLFLNVHVRDIDCAFKLYHSDFLHRHRLETRGAMINAEMLYKLQRDGATFTELPVHHLPRLSGKATGARLSVILRAFGELFLYAYRWRIKKQS